MKVGRGFEEITESMDSAEVQSIFSRVDEAGFDGKVL